MDSISSLYFSVAQAYKETQVLSISKDVLSNSVCLSLTQVKLMMKSEQLQPVSP